MTCDKNANGIADDGEPFTLKEVTLRDGGSCDLNGKTEERLKNPTIGQFKRLQCRVSKYKRSLAMLSSVDKVPPLP